MHVLYLLAQKHPVKPKPAPKVHVETRVTAKANRSKEAHTTVKPTKEPAASRSRNVSGNKKEPAKPQLTVASRYKAPAVPAQGKKPVKETRSTHSTSKRAATNKVRQKGSLVA